MEYVTDIVRYFEKYIGVLPYREAPSHYDKYGDKQYYIKYRKNHITTWYAIYKETNDYLLVTYITNNHVEGQYFNI